MFALEKGELVLARWDLSIAVLESGTDTDTIYRQLTFGEFTYSTDSIDHDFHIIVDLTN